MLKIIHSIQELSYSKWMDVYRDTNLAAGREDVPNQSEPIQLISGEQAHYQYLREVFFSAKDAFCAAWCLEGGYVAALRAEPYRDGFLLSALETQPSQRGKGYATSLLREVLGYLRARGEVPVYTHIDRGNLASLAVHRACGFCQQPEPAVYLDGTIHREADTYCYQP